MPHPSPPPDDWQQAAAQHRQEQFAGNVYRLGKQARSGNRWMGGCLMFFGLLALLIGPLSLMASRRVQWDEILENPEAFLWVTGGALTTMVAGFAVWRGRDRPRR